MISENRIRVLVVDDSAIVRKVLTDALSGEADIEVVGTAPDPFVARDKILSLHPDVLTLDIEMPRMDGVTFLKKLMHHHPMPVIVISSLGIASSRAALDALEAGAIDVLAKPGGPQSVGDLRLSLASKIRAAKIARLRVSAPKAAAPAAPPSRGPLGQPFSASAIIAIGASTGGTEAIQKVLVEFPENCPGVVITQHIPAVFSRSFANRLNELCAIRVREAEDGDRVEPGLALVAPGNFHMLLQRSPTGYRVEIKDGPMVCYQRPSVDILFHSVARAAGSSATGALLTGMGSDGALGMLAMKNAGARTIAQDEASCVVFGMPKEAVRKGAVDRVLPLTAISAAILSDSRRNF
ncbi:MAG TPA: chemotaxis response regulator protein-glutamate methylesterase [Candidatus Sulfopaludibacter sp.]|jgi:two-component system chemotaxis response regulator CheB|nr:chemotaxis response regulator protein-glutamate methylesterase [Candidatus Sulfopaludibacter sp.]